MESTYGGINLEIINCSRIADFNGATRKYYNIYDIRILDVTSYAKEEKFHKHLKVTEVLFVLDGKILAINETESKEILVNQIVVFSPQELHRIEPISKFARILAIKYIRGNDSLISLLSSDWEGI